MFESNNILFFLMGASDSGKTAIERKVAEILEGHVVRCPSLTTRDRRPDDLDDAYKFVTNEYVEAMLTQNQIVEHNMFNGQHYGDLKSAIDGALAKCHVIKSVTPHAYQNYTEKGYRVRTIKIVPTDKQAATRTIEPGRATDDSAGQQIVVPYDLVVENSFAEGGLERAVNQVVQYIGQFALNAHPSYWYTTDANEFFIAREYIPGVEHIKIDLPEVPSMSLIDIVDSRLRNATHFPAVTHVQWLEAKALRGLTSGHHLIQALNAGICGLEKFYHVVAAFIPDGCRAEVASLVAMKLRPDSEAPILWEATIQGKIVKPIGLHANDNPWKKIFNPSDLKESLAQLDAREQKLYCTLRKALTLHSR